MIVSLIILQIFFSIFILSVLIDAFYFFRRYPDDMQDIERKLEQMEESIDELIKANKSNSDNNGQCEKECKTADK